MLGVHGVAFRAALQPVDRENRSEPGNVPDNATSPAAAATATPLSTLMSGIALVSRAVTFEFGAIFTN